MMMPTLTIFHMVVLAAAAALLITAAYTDANRYRIPNRICLALMGLFPLFALTAPRGVDWDQHLMVFGLVLTCGFALFMGNLAGAGDIKLLAATGLWAGPHFIAMFLIVTAIAGGLLAVIMTILTYVRNRAGKQALSLAKVPIPYGIAIAAGGLSIFGMLSYPLLFPS